MILKLIGKKWKLKDKKWTCYLDINTRSHLVDLRSLYLHYPPRSADDSTTPSLNLAYMSPL